MGREMPVQDPDTASDRWSLDFFFADQSGIPTFIECKRFQDTRSRREVVAQMLDYAANGHYYWSKDLLRERWIATARRRNTSIQAELLNAKPDCIDIAGDNLIDDFLEVVESNLREGQIRLIFYMERSPYELRSIVDFLNKQMERTEVLIVEARQYDLDGRRLIDPSLFGYTEEARRIKRKTLPQKVGKIEWDEAGFFEAASQQLHAHEVAAIRQLYDACIESGFKFNWGTGTTPTRGSFSIVIPAVAPTSVIHVQCNGALTPNFGLLRKTDTAMRVCEELDRGLREELRLSIPAGAAAAGKYPGVHVPEWGPKVQPLIKLLRRLSENPTEASL